MQSNPDRPEPGETPKVPSTDAVPASEKSGPGEIAPAERLPVLRRTMVRPPVTGIDPIDGAYISSRLTTLAHELSSLLDGSMRVVGLARRSLDPGHPGCPERIVRQLDTVTAAMMQMADLVRQSMIGLAEGGMNGMRVGFGACSSVGEAVRHAADVMTPLAEDAGIRVDTDISPDLADIVAGPVYAVVSNAMKNAIESIIAAQGRSRDADSPSASAQPAGEIIVRAWMQTPKDAPGARRVYIEIMDDGLGPPIASAGAADGSGPFTPGFSTKPGGSGIGLALSRDIIEQLGGSIELRARPRDSRTGRRGAVLSVSYPAPGSVTRRAIAG